MIVHVMWKSQAKHDGKSNDEQVSGGIHVSKLQIWDSNSGYHAKHDHVNSANNGIWNADEYRAYLTNNPNNHHKKGAKLDHPQTSNLTRHKPDVKRLLWEQLGTVFEHPRFNKIRSIEILWTLSKKISGFNDLGKLET